MKVQKAVNGWPGIFIPGDEAMGLATLMRELAKAVERGELREQSAIFLRNQADKLMTCWVKERT